ncbi:MAG TPA: alternative ribosome rescue aminoacyl-tRNA hydrolase ArfB [bacterium]
MARPTADSLLAAGELGFEFFRSSGPGGQNVNKVETAVRLRFDLAGSGALPQAVKERLFARAGGRMTTGGVLVIEAQRHRTREANRRDALARLDRLIEDCWRPPAPRRPTRPTRAARERRLGEKKGRAETKRLRARPADAE